MKVSPISADLLIKLALVAAGIGLAVYLVRRTSGAAGEAIDKARAALADTADAIIVGTNPVNPKNYVNRALTAAGEALVPADGPGWNADGSWTFGGAAYDVVNSDVITVGLNPMNAGNYVNRAVTFVGSSIVSQDGPGRNADGSWTLGGEAFDVVQWIKGTAASILPEARPDPATWGSEGRRRNAVFDSTTEQIADYSQLGNLGAP